LFPRSYRFSSRILPKGRSTAILLLGIYPREYKSGYNKDTCIPMFIAALFRIDKLWKHPNAPVLMNGLRKKD
jgi:hypothetical protein